MSPSGSAQRKTCASRKARRANRPAFRCVSLLFSLDRIPPPSPREVRRFLSRLAGMAGRSGQRRLEPQPFCSRQTSTLRHRGGEYATLSIAPNFARRICIRLQDKSLGHAVATFALGAFRENYSAKQFRSHTGPEIIAPHGQDHRALCGPAGCGCAAAGLRLESLTSNLTTSFRSRVASIFDHERPPLAGVTREEALQAQLTSAFNSGSGIQPVTDAQCRLGVVYRPATFSRTDRLSRGDVSGMQQSVRRRAYSDRRPGS